MKKEKNRTALFSKVFSKILCGGKKKKGKKKKGRKREGREGEGMGREEMGEKGKGGKGEEKGWKGRGGEGSEGSTGNKFVLLGQGSYEPNSFGKRTSRKTKRLNLGSLTSE